MSKYVIEDTTLTAIGDAIREKDGSTDAILVSDFASKIAAISGGGGAGGATKFNMVALSVSNKTYASYDLSSYVSDKKDIVCVVGWFNTDKSYNQIFGSCVFHYTGDNDNATFPIFGAAKTNPGTYDMSTSAVQIKYANGYIDNYCVMKMSTIDGSTPAIDSQNGIYAHQTQSDATFIPRYLIYISHE